jgi:hypothetical protein
MDAFGYYQPLISSAQYVDEILPILRPITRSPETRDLARRLIAELINGDLSKLRGSANEWFNLITHASQVDYTTAEHAIFDAALLAHPNDVDLLCQWFQFQYAHGAASDAELVWERIKHLGEEETAPYWRYWVYRATFLANYLNDKSKEPHFSTKPRSMWRQRACSTYSVNIASC